MRAALVLAILAALTYATRSFLPPDVLLSGSGGALAFGFILIAAVQTGRIFHTLRLPHLTGFILCGLLFGPEVLGLLNAAMVRDLTLVKKVAVGLIAFTAGAELNFVALRPRMRAIGCTSAFGLVGASACLFGLFYWLTYVLPGFGPLTMTQRATIAFVCAVVLSALSPSVVMGILSEAKAAGPVSEQCLSIVVLADLAIALGFALVDSLARAVFPTAGVKTNVLGDLAIHIVGSMVVGVAVGAVCAVYVKKIGRRVGLFIFSVCFVCAEAGGALHLDPLLLGLAAGLFLENVSPVSGRQVIHDTESAAMPTFAVFFAVIGAEVHLHAFLSVAPYAIAAAVARAIGMYVGARQGARVGRVPPDQARQIPFGMLPQAGIAIGLANLVQQRYAWGPLVSNVLLGAVVVNEMLGPILFRRALGRAGETGRKVDESVGPPSLAPSSVAPSVPGAPQPSPQA